MPDDGDLRARLARLDPARRLGATDPAESPTAHEIRERVMQTIDEATSTSVPPARRSRWRGPALIAGAAASVAAIAMAAFALGGGGDASAPKPVAKTPTTVTLTAQAGGDGLSSSSCVPFSVATLRDMPVALAGTVVSVAPEAVTLDVDRWYKGGSADRVTIATPEGATSVALDGVEFTQGGRYLLTATEGTVNTCGYSGPATAELEASFAEAFPG